MTDTPKNSKTAKRITLCGSTKFKKEFEAINRQLSLEGNVVYSVAFFGHADNVPLTKEQKENLDRVHKQKIDNSDGIFVINVDGYIGESTKSEIQYAYRTEKFVRHLSEYPDLKMICDATLFTPTPQKEDKDYEQEIKKKLLDLMFPHEGGYPQTNSYVESVYGLFRPAMKEKEEEIERLKKVAIEFNKETASARLENAKQSAEIEKLTSLLKRAQSFTGSQSLFYEIAEALKPHTNG